MSWSAQDSTRSPDVKMRLWLVPHGYQADFVVRGAVVLSCCRDYSTSVKSKDDHVGAVLEELGEALARLRERFA